MLHGKDRSGETRSRTLRGVPVDPGADRATRALRGPRDRRRGRTRSARATAGRAALGVLLGSLGMSACTSLDDSIQDLHRGHHDASEVLAGPETVDTHFRSPGFLERDGDWIRDPLTACFENVLRLADGNSGVPETLARQVLTYGWLLEDCSYALTRERVTTEVGKLCLRVGLGGPVASPAQPTSPEELQAGLERLSLAQPTGDGAASISELSAMDLDLAGTLELLAVTGTFREAQGAGAELHQKTLRRALGLTLATALLDPEPRVRACAIQAWSRLSSTSVEGAAPLQSAQNALATGLRDPSLEVIRAVAEALREGPAPSPPGSDLSGPDAEDYWMSRMVEVLTRAPTGPTGVACCQALAHLSGRPRNLHPEAWLSWWQDRETPETSDSGRSGSARASANSE